MHSYTSTSTAKQIGLPISVSPIQHTSSTIPRFVCMKMVKIFLALTEIHIVHLLQNITQSSLRDGSIALCH